LNVVPIEGFRFSHYRIPNVPPPEIEGIIAELKRRAGKRWRFDNRKEIQGIILHSHRSYERDSRKVTGVFTLLEREAVILEDPVTKIFYFDYERALYILKCIKKDREPSYKTPTERKERLAELKARTSKGEHMEPEKKTPVNEIAIKAEFRVFATPDEVDVWKDGGVRRPGVPGMSELELARYRIEPIKERPVLEIAPAYMEVIQAIEVGKFKPEGKNWREAFKAWIDATWPGVFDARTAELKFTRYYPNRLQHGWGLIYEDASGRPLTVVKGFERFRFVADPTIKVRRVTRGSGGEDDAEPFVMPDVKSLSDGELDALAELVHAERSERLERQLESERKVVDEAQAKLAALEARKAALVK